MNENFKYYEIGNRKFKIEKIDPHFYEITIFENNKFQGTYCFIGSNAYGKALARILSYNEIDDERYNAEE